MMRKLIYLSAIIILSLSCEKIIAEDITGKLPVIILPAVNDTVQTNPVHFKWHEMEGATKYHLMVVSPGFSAISSYVLDTFVTGTNFYYSLDSNEYEMKLSAHNGGYVSDTIGPIKFWVGVQPTGTGGSVVLISPAAGIYENASFNNQFEWEVLSNVSSYEFSIREGSSFASGSILDAQNNIGTFLYTTPAILDEGEYHWGVKAYLTGGGETNFTTRQLYVDETNPNVALLTSPFDFAFLNPGIITFAWNNGTDPGTIHAPVNSLFEIATDAGFSNLVQLPLVVQGNFADVNLTPNTYYWRVTNSDDAGNAASSSTTFQLTVN